MGNCCPCSEELMYDIAKVHANSDSDKKFKSRKLSAPIKKSKSEVDQGYQKFLENEAEMEILARQATAISREVMKNTLTRWETELKLNSNDYDDLKKLFDVAERNPDWPQHLEEDELWETTQLNKASRTSWLYFYVKRSDIITDSDVQTFDLAICHLITSEANISRNVLIGGLIKKGLLLEDDEDNIYLKFQ